MLNAHYCASWQLKKRRDMINRVIIEGNLTDNVDLRKTQSGKLVTSFTVACSEGTGDKKYTEFVDVTAWEKTAELISRYCQKGTRVLIEGKLRTDSYDKNGQKMYRTYVLANNVEFLDRTKTEPQTTLTGDDGRDMFGRKPVEDVKIDADELPFY